jgi:hypothetical protein
VARTVGNIEIIVDARTDKLKAQVVRASKEAGEAGGEAIEEGLNDVDFRKLQTRIKALRGEIQTAMAGIEVDLGVNDDRLERNLAVIRERIRQQQIALVLTAELQDEDIQAELLRLRAELSELSRVDVEGHLVFSQAEIREQIAFVESQLGDIEALIKVRISEAEQARVIAELKATGESVPTIDLKVKMGILPPTPGDIEAANARIDAELDDVKVDVDLELDHARFLAAQFQAEMEKEQILFDVEPVVQDSARAHARIQRTIDAMRISAEIDTIDFEALTVQVAKQRIEAEFENLRIEATVGFDSSLTDLKIAQAEMQAELESNRLKVFLDPEFANLTLAQQELQLELDRIRLEAIIDPEFRRLSVEAAKLRVQQQLEGLRAEVEVKVDVDPELTALREAQAKMQAELERQRLRVLVDPEFVNRTIAQQQLQLQLDEIQLEAHATLEFQRLSIAAARQRVQQELEGLQAEIEIGFDPRLTDLRLAQARLQAQLDREKLAVHVDPEFANLTVAKARLQTQLDLMDLEVNADPEFANRSIAKKKLELQLAAMDLEAQVDPEFSALSLQLAKLRAENSIGKIKADIEIEEHRFDPDAEKAGKSAGLSFSDGFGDSAGRGLSTRMRLILVGVAALTGPAGVGALGLLGDAVELLSSAFSALSGTILAASPILAAFLGTTAAAVIGFSQLSGVMSAIGKVQKEGTEITDEQRAELEKLGPAALAAATAFDPFAKEIVAALDKLPPVTREFATEIARLSPVFSELKANVSDAVFAGLGDRLAILANTVLPDLERALVVLGGAFNVFLKSIATAAENIDFSGLAEALVPALDSVAEAVGTIVVVIGKFFEGAAPGAARLADMFARTAEAFGEFIDKVSASGALDTFLDRGLDSLSAWFDLLKSVGSVLSTVFEAGAERGDRLVKSLSDIVARFNDWLESTAGQKALIDFFDTAESVMTSLIPLLKGVQGFFDNLISDAAVASFADLADALGDVLPFLGKIFEAISRTNILNTFVRAIALLGDAIEPIIPSLDHLADSIAAGLADALGEIGKVLPDVAEAFGRMADAVSEPVASAIGAFAEAIAELLIALRPMIDIIARLPPDLLQMAATFVLVNKALGPLGGLAKDAAKAIGDIQKAMRAGTSFITAFATSATGIGLAFGAIAAAAAIAITALSNFNEANRRSSKLAKEAAGGFLEQVAALKELKGELSGPELRKQTIAGLFAGASEEGQKLAAAAAVLKVDLGDLEFNFRRLNASEDSARVRLTQIGRDMGLTAEEARVLATAVIETDDAVTASLTASAELGRTLVGAGLSIQVVTKAMDQFQDSAETFNLDKFAREVALQLATSANKADQALLRMAERISGVDRSAAHAAPLLETIFDLMSETGPVVKAQQAIWKALATALNLSAESFGLVVIAAIKLRAAIGDIAPPVVIKDLEAFKATLKEIARAAALAGDEMFRDAVALDDMRSAATKLNDQADAFLETWDLLFGGQIRVEESADAVGDAFAEMANKIAEATSKGELWRLGIKGIDDEARENRGFLRDQSEAIKKNARDLLASGASRDEVTKAIDENVKSLREELKFLGATPAEVEEIIKSFGLDPEAIKLVLDSTGLDEHRKAVEDEIALIDELTGEKITTFLAPELIQRITETTTYKELIDGVDGRTVTTVLTLIQSPEFVAALTGMENLNAQIAAIPPELTLPFGIPGLDESVLQMELLRQEAQKAAEAFEKAGFSQLARNGQLNSFARGGWTGSGWGIGGEAGSELATLSSGRSTVINSPTLLPPGTFVTPLGELAAINASATARPVTNNIVVNTIVPDPLIVAEQVLNRSAMMIRN